MKKTLLTFLIPLIMGAGCAHNPLHHTKDPIKLPNGYTTDSHATIRQLKIITGIYSGLIKIEKTEDNIWYLSGTPYKYTQDPETFNKVMEDTDRDGDTHLSGEEVMDHTLRTYNEYSENQD